jgi:hypothetical protein
MQMTKKQILYIKSQNDFNKTESKFFECSILLNTHIDILWNFFKDLRNVHIWHPHMYLIEDSINNSEEESVYSNKYYYYDLGIKKLQIKSIDRFTINVNIISLDKEYSCNLYNMILDKVNSEFTELKFTRVTISDHDSISRNRLKILIDIAQDICYRIYNLNYNALICSK